MTVAIDVLRKATGFLRDRGVANPRLDAELLLADVLGVDRVGVYLSFERPLTEEELTLYRERIRRRGRREPLQHIRGRQEFFSREFRVDRTVLVPRPETETLVETALERIRGRPAARVLDVGTGCGAIAITLALEAPGSKVCAVDVSAEAVEVARDNAGRLGAGVDLRAGDLFEPFHGERFDLVVSNPPYVRTEAIAALEPEVRDFDPRAALDGGEDGLDFQRRLATNAGSALVEGGALVVEVGAGQARAVADLFASAGLVSIWTRSDLAGIERVVGGVRAASAGAGY